MLVTTHGIVTRVTSVRNVAGSCKSRAASGSVRASIMPQSRPEAPPHPRLSLLPELKAAPRNEGTGNSVPPSVPAGTIAGAGKSGSGGKTQASSLHLSNYDRTTPARSDSTTNRGEGRHRRGNRGPLVECGAFPERRIRSDRRRDQKLFLERRENGRTGFELSQSARAAMGDLKRRLTCTECAEVMRSGITARLAQHSQADVVVMALEMAYLSNEVRESHDRVWFSILFEHRD
jgi:hypothetical protein